MEKLIWTHTPLLTTVHPLEEHVQQISSRISKAVGKIFLSFFIINLSTESSLKPLTQYLRTYDVHKHLLQLSVESYAAEFKSQKHTLEEYKDEVTTLLRQQEELEAKYVVLCAHDSHSTHSQHTHMHACTQAFVSVQSIS